MELENKIKRKNKIIILLASLLTIVVLAVVIVIAIILIALKESTNYDGYDLSGQTYLYTCYPFGNQPFCEENIGSYYINGKEYKIKTIQYPTSGFAGSELLINDINTEIGYVSGLQYIELFNDEFFLVKAEDSINILDLDLNIIKKINLWIYYNNTQTINKDGKYYIKYTICEDNTYKERLLNLQNLTEEIEITNLANVNCTDNYATRTRYFK